MARLRIKDAVLIAHIFMGISNRNDWQHPEVKSIIGDPSTRENAIKAYERLWESPVALEKYGDELEILSLWINDILTD